MKADRFVNFIDVAPAERVRKFSFRLFVQRKGDQPRRVAVKPVHGARAALLQCKKERLRLHAGKFIGDQYVFVGVHFAVEGLCLFRRGRVVGDLVAGGKHRVFPRPHAVHADVAVA